MSFDLSPENLWSEIQESKAQRDKHLSASELTRKRYAGPYWYNGTTGEPGGTSFPENYYFDYVASNLPAICYDNPRASVKSRRGTEFAQYAEAMRHALNRNIKDIKLQQELAHCCQDGFFNFGVALTGMEPAAGSKLEDRWEFHDGEPRSVERDEPVTRQRPNVWRISQRRFLMDPLALKLNETRWRGHMWVRSREEILAEAREDPDSGWNVEALRNLKDVESQPGPPDLPERNGARDEKRDEVWGYDMWVPEADPGEHGFDSDKYGAENGYHGMLFTLADGEMRKGAGEDSEGFFLREPRPFYGPRTGPYRIFGVYTVSDSPWPLSPLTAAEEQIRELNDHAVAISTASRKRKKLTLYDEAQADFAERINDAPEGGMLGVPGFDESTRVEEIELFGVSPEQIEVSETILRPRAQRATGLHDARRGSVQGDATATEVAVAEQGIQQALGWVQKQFATFAAGVLEDMAWHIWHQDRVVIPLGEDYAREAGEPAEFIGGVDPMDDVGFEDLEFDIEPMSMSRPSEALQKANFAQLHQILMPALQVMPMTAAFFHWQGYFEEMGKRFDFPELANLASADKAAMMGAQQMAHEGESGGGGQPRFAQDKAPSGGGGPGPQMAAPSQPKTGFAGNTTGNQAAGAVKSGKPMGVSQ